MNVATTDRLLALLLLPLVLPVLGILFVLMIVMQGRPFLYVSERMCSVDQSFNLYKIRTMRPDASDEGVSGGHSRSRMTPLGYWLRRLRLDELPQIFNVLRGDIRFIGPRPPLRKHMELCPQRYGRLFSMTKPGITGLATVTVHAREERLLSRCVTEEESERVYRERCLPLKLRLEGMYLRKRSFALNAMILWRTFSKLTLTGRRKPLRPTRLQRVLTNV